MSKMPISDLNNRGFFQTLRHIRMAAIIVSQGLKS